VRVQVVALVVLLGCDREDLSQQTRELSAQECSSPARCADSEAALPSAVAPGRSEQWRAGSVQALQALVATTDSDGDGVPAAHDCDDTDKNRFPRAFDVMCDGIDQNCDGFDSCDRDNDRFVDNADCDPDDPGVTDQCQPTVVRQPLL
jgi:hypothetical protein